MAMTRFDNILNSDLCARVRSLEINNNILTISFSCPKGDYEWKGIVIGYDYKIDKDKEEYLIEPESLKDNKIDFIMTCKADLSEIPFKPTNWHIKVAYEEAGEVYAASALYKIPKQGIRFLSFAKTHFEDGKGNILFPYRSRAGYLGFHFREKNRYDRFSIKAKEVAALLIYEQRRKHLRGKNIWLIYEKRCAKAQDNAYYLFKYCMDYNMEQQLNREIYYVIESDAADMRKLAPYKHRVLKFCSLKHMLYLLACKLLLSSDSRAHAYIWQYEKSIIAPRLNKKKHIFLGHGVLALKKLNDSFLAKRMNSVMTTVTSQDEAEIVINHLGFKRHEAVITGYARFDALKDTSADYNEILIMPTHRSWLFGVDRDTFVSSEYYKRYMDIINSTEFIKMLEDKNLTAQFYVHPSIKEHRDAFTSSSDRIHITEYDEVSLDDLMMRCKMLITDYSSVCWDVYYMGKPMVFYQYDLQEYIDTWGSYVDLEKDSPGLRATTHEELTNCIKAVFDNDFKLDDYWSSKRESHYRFIDTDNCKRICEALKERGY